MITTKRTIIIVGKAWNEKKIRNVAMLNGDEWRDSTYSTSGHVETQQIQGEFCMSSVSGAPLVFFFFVYYCYYFVN